MSDQPARSTTSRGFTTYDQFADAYGNTIIVRESSAAQGSRVWVFFDAIDRATVGAHLTVAEATRLRDALGAFLSDQGAADA